MAAPISTETGAGSPPSTLSPHDPRSQQSRHGKAVKVEHAQFSVDHLSLPAHYMGDIASILIPHGLLLDRIEKLAMDIADKYKNTELHIVCVLKGSRGFFTTLLHYLTQICLYRQSDKENPPFIEHYVRILPSSQRVVDADNSNISITSEKLSTFRGKHVLIVEDLVNSGATLSLLLKQLEIEGAPASVRVATLCLKESARKKALVRANFCGFTVPDVYLAGFSLDFEERYRDLEHICVLSEAGLERAREMALKRGEELRQP